MVCFVLIVLFLRNQREQLSAGFRGPQRFTRYKQHRRHLVCDYPMLREEKWFFFWSLRDQPWAAHMTEFFQPLHFSVEGWMAQQPAS